MEARFPRYFFSFGNPNMFVESFPLRPRRDFIESHLMEADAAECSACETAAEVKHTKTSRSWSQDFSSEPRRAKLIFASCYPTWHASSFDTRGTLPQFNVWLSPAESMSFTSSLRLLFVQHNWLRPLSCICNPDTLVETSCASLPARGCHYYVASAIS